MPQMGQIMIPVPAPVGTNLQLIDKDVTRPPHTSQVSSEQSPSRQYPLRERRPPARLNDYVLSRIRDI